MREQIFNGSSLKANAAAPPLEDRLGAAPAVMQLARFQCRWPIGSVDSDTFHFCARPTDPAVGPQYCETHRGLAYPRKPVPMVASV
jgi:hypothetical protein